jgi:hypothetical protein
MTVYHLIDQNTGEEVYPSDQFRFLDKPVPNHRIQDEVLRDRYGGPAIVNRVEDAGDGSVKVYIDGNEEILNDNLTDPDQSYRRS